jgi:hypothetical protein
MLPQSLHLPLLPAASSLIRIARPHFGQANLMVMARDPLGLRVDEMKNLSSSSMETEGRRIKCWATKSSQTAHHQVVARFARQAE